MEMINEWVGALNGLVWGWPMLVMILGTGIFLTAGLKVMPVAAPAMKTLLTRKLISTETHLKPASQ